MLWEQQFIAIYRNFQKEFPYHLCPKINWLANPNGMMIITVEVETNRVIHNRTQQKINDLVCNAQK